LCVYCEGELPHQTEYDANEDWAFDKDDDEYDDSFMEEFGGSGRRRRGGDDDIDTQGQNIGRIPDIFPGIFHFQILIGKEIIYIFQFDANWHSPLSRMVVTSITSVLLSSSSSADISIRAISFPGSHFIQGKKGRPSANRRSSMFPPIYRATAEKVCSPLNS